MQSCHSMTTDRNEGLRRERHGCGTLKKCFERDTDDDRLDDNEELFLTRRFQVGDEYDEKLS